MDFIWPLSPLTFLFSFYNKSAVNIFLHPDKFQTVFSQLIFAKELQGLGS